MKTHICEYLAAVEKETAPCGNTERRWITWAYAAGDA